MGLDKALVKYVTWPFWCFYAKKYKIPFLTYYYQSNKWCGTPELQKARQLKKLKSLLDYVYVKNRYYRDLFKSIGFRPDSFSDFEQLNEIPELTKDIIRDQGDRLISDDFDKNDLYLSKTGGSTGTPLTFYRDNRSLSYKWAQHFYFDRWIGGDIGVKKALFVASPHLSKGVAGIKEKIKNSTNRRLIAFDPLRIEDSYMHEFYGELKSFNPEVIDCFPSSLMIFADFLDRNNLSGIKVKSIGCTGETLYSHQKEYFQKIFHAEIFEKYACFEHGVLACECSVHNGLHVFTDNDYIDNLYDKNSMDNIQDLIITNLTNYSMPLIRYRIGDKAIFSDAACQCGSRLPLIKKLLGRDRDIVLTKGSKPVPGYLLVEVVNKNQLPGQFQFIQREKGELTINLVGYDLLSDEQETLLMNKVRTIMGEDANIKINPLDDIEREKSGKYAYVKSLVK